MPEISLEIMCLIIIGFVSIMFFSNNKLDKNDSLHAMFSRLVFGSFINMLAEMQVSFSLAHIELVSLDWIFFSMQIYFISLLCLFYISYEYMRRLINVDLPGNRQVGRWTNAVVAGILVITEVIPITGLREVNGHFTFEKYVLLAYVLLVAFELFTVYIFLVNRKNVNEKRKKIIVLNFSCQVIVIVIQGWYPHFFLSSIGVILVILSFYMTLENEDVKLIEQLSVEKDRADAANTAKSDFIANVSHEIRTPINAVLGMDEMILRETKEDNTRQYAYDIKSAAQTLHGIINEILDMSKLESGKMEIVPVKYNMRSLVNDTINMIQLKADAKHLEFKVEVDEEMPAGFVGDETRIKQILTNLLGNAVKYTETGYVSLSIRGMRENDKNERVCFEVEDSGIGMKEEDIQRITQAYLRFDERKNRNVEGSGLGMTITMQLLEMMNSKMVIKSDYGVGTKIVFNILQPIWDETKLGDFRHDSQLDVETYSYEKTFEAPTTKVLVVDDNAMNRKVFRALLKETKLDIDEAESGAECLNMVRKNIYDIIFMDHMMPGMDGVEAFHKLKTMEGNLSIDAPVIMLTANAVGGAKEQYMEEGFDDFIAKPIVPGELEKKIKKYIKE